MKNLISLIRSKYPEMLELLQPASEDQALMQKFQEIGLPEDYYLVYQAANGEKQESDGIFGLLKLLPLEVAYEQIVRDKEELINFRGKYYYEIFVPIFKTPGRALVGYAKREGRWEFTEYDLDVSKSRDAETLTEFLANFENKLVNDGYATEEGFKGLIDRDEM